MTDRSLRYEIKMVSQASARGWLESWMRFDPTGIRVLYPDRRVQSIYFDDLWQTALQENLAGISHREKLRFRWYGDEARGVRGNLERKVRQNQLGWKDVCPIDASIDVEGSERRALAHAVFSRLPDDWAADRDRSLMPSQWITYLRSYYTTADRRIRITVDRDLTASDQRHRHIITNAHRTPLPDITIVEAKCDQSAYAEAKHLLNRFPLVVDKCSKFVLASHPGSGPEISIVA